jgi:hypothetical protein
VVRIHEAAGRLADARVTLDVGYTGVEEVNLLEEPVADGTPQADSDGELRVDASGVALNLTPFSVRTLRFTLRQTAAGEDAGPR